MTDSTRGYESVPTLAGLNQEDWDRAMRELRKLYPDDRVPFEDGGVWNPVIERLYRQTFARRVRKCYDAAEIVFPPEDSDHDGPRPDCECLILIAMLRGNRHAIKQMQRLEGHGPADFKRAVGVWSLLIDQWPIGGYDNLIPPPVPGRHRIVEVAK